MHSSSVHTVTLESARGTVIAEASAVSNDGLINCYRRFAAELSKRGAGLVFVDGRAYGLFELVKLCRTVNRHSQDCGGSAIYAIPAELATERTAPDCY